MAVWQTPKTDWAPDDYVNIEDYERIAGNIMYLYELAQPLYPELDISALPRPGETAPGDIMDWMKAARIESGTMQIAETTFRPSDYEELSRYAADIGPNAPAWSYVELNIIERDLMRMKNILDSQAAGRAVLAFELGGGTFGQAI